MLIKINDLKLLKTNFKKLERKVNSILKQLNKLKISVMDNRLIKEFAKIQKINTVFNSWSKDIKSIYYIYYKFIK